MYIVVIMGLSAYNLQHFFGLYVLVAVVVFVL